MLLSLAPARREIPGRVLMGLRRPEGMILILTFHKVVDAPADEREFYTISREQFQEQLEKLAQAGFSALSPADLRTGNLGTRSGCLLTFDDGTADHHEVVLPLLARYRHRAVFFVPTAKLDRPGYLTTSQAIELHRAGHTLGLHSHEHRRLDTLQEEELRVQMEVSHQRLQELTGQRPVFFAPVGGYVNARIRHVASEMGVEVLRTMHWGYNARVKLTDLECAPINQNCVGGEFDRILKLQNRFLIYKTKEIVKTLVPLALYAALRRRIAGPRKLR